jgi:pilus assembly protein CpaB
MKKVYLLAVIAALITMFAAYEFITKLEDEIKNEVEGAVSVVVAATQLEPNTVIDESMLTIKQVSAELVGNDTVQLPDQVIGKIVKYTISQGEPIYITRLSELGTDKAERLSHELSQGMRAFSMSVDAVSGVSQYIKSGDRVDIIAYTNKGEVEEKKIAFENMLILRTGTASETGAEASPYSTITLAVTPEQAVELNYLIANSIIRLILRSPLD